MNPGEAPRRTTAWGRGPYDTQILALALPALGALASDPLVSLVDTAFIGRLGAVPLAALGINTALFTFVFVVFNFLAYATTPRIARALGRGDRDGAGRIVTHVVVLALGLGLVSLLTLQLFARPLLTLLGAEGAVLDEGLSYLRPRAVAGPALLLVTAGHGVFRGFQDTRTPLLVTLGLNLVNLVLDPLLIFGAGWGLTGAGIATAAAQWTGAVAFLVLFYGPAGRAKRVALAWPSWRDLVPLLRVGGVLTLRTYALIGLMSATTAVAARVGVLEVAAHQIAFQFWIFLSLVIDALAIAAQALVARLLGAGDVDGARAVAHRLLAIGLALGAALGGLFLIVRTSLPWLFATDADVVAGVVALMPFVALMQPLNALVFVWDGVFMAIEDFAFLALAMVASALVSGAVLALVLPLGWGIVGVWWAIVVLMATRASTLWWRYRTHAFAPRQEVPW